MANNDINFTERVQYLEGSLDKSRIIDIDARIQNNAEFADEMDSLKLYIEESENPEIAFQNLKSFDKAWKEPLSFQDRQKPKVVPFNWYYLAAACVGIVLLIVGLWPIDKPNKNPTQIAMKEMNTAIYDFSGLKSRSNPSSQNQLEQQAKEAIVLKNKEAGWELLKAIPNDSLSSTFKIKKGLFAFSIGKKEEGKLVFEDLFKSKPHSSDMCKGLYYLALTYIQAEDTQELNTVIQKLESRDKCVGQIALLFETYPDISH